ncbi:hypothetical protein SAMN04489761_3787 [Tenacibaculum sp. MAR_2009_124]|uniref:DUF4843 domain-containing protein n=1 Tax=Tenacibaculum sp. MAR_2009_124 TaxID=1250059 RepID=UPI0008985339|nr:DUF4843 domain-containing protein [Tenacibaculum sp. MAR_2009_124]SEC85739.1 hypothetical protein SAMN04489761_3787 [Tenacibaculum sp. MAR_2009_124]
MKKITYRVFTMLALLLITISCNDEVEFTNYATFEKNSSDVGVPPNSEIVESIIIYTGNIVGNDRSIEIIIDEDESTISASAYSIPSSITIPANTNSASLDITFKDEGLDIATDKILVLNLKGSDDFYVGEKITLNVSKVCNSGMSKAKVTLDFDDWPEEAYWSITNTSTGEVVLASAATPSYGAYAGMTGSLSSAICLSPGDYVIQIYDAYGDGGTGYVLTLNGANVFTASGNYGSYTSSTFTVQ